MGRIRIIGTGAACAAGFGVEKGFAAVVDGVDGLRPLTLFDAQLREVPPVGEITQSPEDILCHAVPNRTASLALAVIREAIGRLDIPPDLRLGLVFATTVAGITVSERFYENLRGNPEAAKDAAAALAFHEPAAVSGWLARAVGACGIHTISTACSTGLHAIGMAKRLVENGTYDCCLAVGADALSLLTVRGFASLMLIDFSGCKPFDARRVGISLGEGAGAMLLASDEAAESLKAATKGFVAGWGASADAHHMTAPHPEGNGAFRSAEAALAEAGIAAADIGFVTAHATATPDNDRAEANAMKKLFGPAPPPLCSMKRSLGHTLAASGTLEAVFALEAINAGIVPATGGFAEPDDTIGLVPSVKAEKSMRYALKNAFGFGGNNASIIVERGES